MVHKRYVKRGKKLHGPYYYESYRDEEGKTRKRYLGRKRDLKFLNLTQKKILFLYLFLGLLIFSLFFFFSFQERITGEAITVISDEGKLGKIESITTFSKVSGNLSQKNEVFTIFENDAHDGVFVGGDFSWTNYILEGKVTDIESDGGLGLIFRFVDANNYYIAFFDTDDHLFEFWKKEQGKWSLSQSVSYPQEIGKEYLMNVDVNEDSFGFFVNKVHQFTVKDSSFSSGKVGLYTWHQNGQFRDITVQLKEDNSQKNEI